jgi:hypothetical protein
MCTRRHQASKPANSRQSGCLQDQRNPTWEVKHRGAWVGSSMIRRAVTSTYQVVCSRCIGTADAVLSFWASLNFRVAYDVIQDGSKGICHSAGFAISACWAQVRHLHGSCLLFMLMIVPVWKAVLASALFQAVSNSYAGRSALALMNDYYLFVHRAWLTFL